MLLSLLKYSESYQIKKAPLIFSDMVGVVFILCRLQQTEMNDYAIMLFIACY